MAYEQVEVHPAPPFAPWRTMWLHPRATIRAIVDSANPTQSVARLAILIGFYQALLCFFSI